MGCPSLNRTWIARLLVFGALCVPGGLTGGCTGTPGIDPGINSVIDGGGASLEDAGAADAGPEILEADSYCERIATFFCPYYLRCGRMAVDTVEACEAVMAEACEGRYEPRYVGLAEAGLLTLSADGLDACEAHLSTVTCEEQIRDLDGPCADMWVGTVEAGGACAYDVESFVCAPGNTCVVGLDLCGTCEAASETGGPCGDASDNRCMPDADCVDDVCVARPLAGQACTTDGPRCALGAQCVDDVCQGPTYVDVGDSCDQARRCPFHSFCAAGTCTLAASLGQSCTPGTVDCDSGWCDNGTCAALKAEGDSCTSGTECGSGRCDTVCLGFPTSCITD